MALTPMVPHNTLSAEPINECLDKNVDKRKTLFIIHILEGALTATAPFLLQVESNEMQISSEGHFQRQSSRRS